MSGTLFVVATPIGNLEDITLRALRILREADLIAAEDTRRTAKLLTHYAISTPTLSFHEHNSRQRVPQLLERLQAGAKVALVSDAGTPGISDPGLALVQACWQKAIPVDPVPGACASLAAAVASGFPLEPLTIRGFVPTKAKDRKEWFEGIRDIPSTVVFFESPHRIKRTLAELPSHCGNRPIVVARELTKAHQELVSGEPEFVVGQITNWIGEFTVVLGPAKAVHAVVEEPSGEAIYEDFCRMTDYSPSRRAAVASLAAKYGQSTKYIYQAIERFRRTDS